ncbi:hypothetical protein GUITHDRAFT_122658 [Guillardia theta CCMP2712]|uniref:Uncharacterized protein n=1 Tax=Guillardia theta (strain CCMP2712) TaxID=905079 RepID=L1I4E2_GUITC|nr:hypothetical protein GUITHDRAFT_122658 [Guillardia theta CCMP2712]EKX31143.1 hypothetical protein GUITHDRAFT_122658 [Guillardia theta CCMP2712]|eukprot:XP_005818123.1 hypothetical protein GUITHDRAFT_122658 [Guillardia theta CCMP2712]
MLRGLRFKVMEGLVMMLMMEPKLDDEARPAAALEAGQAWLRARALTLKLHPQVLKLKLDYRRYGEGTRRQPLSLSTLMRAATSTPGCMAWRQTHTL